MKKRRHRLLMLAALPTLVGCAQGPLVLPGGATEAAVFFTPDVRHARDAAGHVFRGQHAEYARRDSATGVRRASARANLYPPQPGYRSTTRSEYTRVIATDDGYRVLERSSATVNSGTWTHRRR